MFSFFKREKKKKKLGIAFGGGGLRGFAEIGAWKCLEDNEIPMADMVAGTSVGSMIAFCYALGYKAQDVMDYAGKLNMDFMKMPGSNNGGDFIDMVKFLLNSGDKRFSLARSSEMIEDFARGFIAEKTFADTKIPAYAIATDLIKGQQVILHDQDITLAKACRASSSIPGVLSPTPIDDMLLVDGYLLNNMPADLLRQKDMDIVLGITLSTNPYPGLKSEKYFDIMFATMDIMAVYGKTRNYDLCDVLVTPDLSEFTSYSFEKEGFQIMFDRGYKAMQQKISILKELL